MARLFFNTHEQFWGREKVYLLPKNKRIKENTTNLFFLLGRSGKRSELYSGGGYLEDGIVNHARLPKNCFQLALLLAEATQDERAFSSWDRFFHSEWHAGDQQTISGPRIPLLGHLDRFRYCFSGEPKPKI